jgi:hypothetical protein
LFAVFHTQVASTSARWMSNFDTAAAIASVFG